MQRILATVATLGTPKSDEEKAKIDAALAVAAAAPQRMLKKLRNVSSAFRRGKGPSRIRSNSASSRVSISGKPRRKSQNSGIQRRDSTKSINRRNSKSAIKRSRSNSTGSVRRRSSQSAIKRTNSTVAMPKEGLRSPIKPRDRWSSSYVACGSANVRVVVHAILNIPTRHHELNLIYPTRHHELNLIYPTRHHEMNLIYCADAFPPT